MPTTPRLHLPYPVETDPADVPVDLAKLAQALDPAAGSGVPLDGQGALGGLPAPGTVGRYYWATDQGTLYRDDGTTWHIVGPQPGDLKHGAGTGGGLGWLLCDGAAISRAGANAALFTAIGITWGAGDGSTTFNLPDMRGRQLLAAGQGAGLSARALGARGGEENHQMVTAEMASHTHAVGDPGHGHGVVDPQHAHGAVHDTYTPEPIGTIYQVAAGGVNFWRGRVGTGAAGTGIGVATGGTGIGLYGAGGDVPHNNMPPFAVANVFVKQ